MEAPLQIQSIFFGNELKLKHSEALERIGNYHFPTFILLFICCALVVYIYLRYYKKTGQVFSSVISYSASQQIQRDGHSFFRSFSVSLFLIYMICGGIFFTDLSVYFGWLKILSPEMITAVSIVIIGVLILLRRLLTNFFGLIIKEKNATEDYFYQYSFNIYVGAFVLLGFCLLLRYTNLPESYLLPITISILGVLYVIRMTKMVTFGYSAYGFSLFHLVLYLCAVEIIPLAVFIKIILNG
ncbi:MAG: DUF4271 domain-containing protein [Bacteroidia bacterium]